MGLFKRKRREPVVHPVGVWRIHCAADQPSVVARLQAYADLGGSGDPVELQLDTAEGWATVVLRGPLHPWAPHQLAMWLLDGPDARVVMVAEPAGTRPGYWLVDDAHDSWMSGYDDTGTAVTVDVPSNEVVRGDALDHPPRTATEVLRAFGVPAGLWTTTGTVGIALTLEDPQHDLNPTLEATHTTRDGMAQDGYFPY